jgi:hypothetical protein
MTKIPTIEAMNRRHRRRHLILLGLLLVQIAGCIAYGIWYLSQL